MLFYSPTGNQTGLEQIHGGNTLKAPLAISLITLILFGCGKSESEKDISYSSDLRSAVQAFEKARVGTIDQIGDTVDRVLDLGQEDSLESSTVVLKGVASLWETEWKTAEKRFEDLESRFLAVKRTSDAFFNHISDLNSQVMDKSKQARAKQQNDTARSYFESQLRETTVVMEKLRMAIQSGNDQHLLLRQAQLRSEIDLNVLELQNISESARVLLVELERLTKEGEKLLTMG